MQDYTYCSTLGDGRWAGFLCLEVCDFPSIRSLEEFSNAREAHEKYRQEMSNLLLFITRTFKATQAQRGTEMSLEYALASQSVQHQPFAAGIRVFLILRAIDKSVLAINSVLLPMAQRFESLLRSECYTYQYAKPETLFQLLENLKPESAVSLVKEDRIHPLQSPTMQACFSVDRFASEDTSRKRILDDLAQYPNCYVSFQLIPTAFSVQEQALLTGNAQALHNLVRGVSDQGTNMNVSYTSARGEAETYSYYADRAADPLYRYAVYVEGTKEGVSNISGALMQTYTGCAAYTTALKSIPIDPSRIDYRHNPCTLPWIVSDETQTHNATCATRQAIGDYSAYARLPYCVTADEASFLLHLPIGDGAVGAGLSIDESRHVSKAFHADVVNGGNLSIGVLRSSSGEDSIGMTLNDFTKHMLVTGTPGSGKTTFLVGLLDRLWKQYKIPFLVIEPVKNEYRALIQSIPDLQIFTPGKSNISPFVFNPFLPPKNVRLEAFKPALLTAFSAAVSMSTPLDRIFEDSITNCYGDHHWFDMYTSDDGAEVFSISDFIVCFQKTFEEIGYTGDARNIGRAGIVRLRSLAKLFDNYTSIPIEHLIERPTVVELSALESTEQKSLIIALLLLSILNYVNANRVGDGHLHNMILLEEAHVLMAADSGNRFGEADPSAVAQKLIVRMLAEIRSYGVGMILADQSPRKVGADVLALTDTKLSFRLVEARDRQMITDSTGLSEAQQMRLSRFMPGEAVLFFGKLDEPEEIRIPDYRLENHISITLTDEEIGRNSQYWRKHAALLRPYPECGFAPCCTETCSYQTRCLAKEIARRIHHHNFTEKEIELQALQALLKRLNSLIRGELRREKFTEQLFHCVIIHLFRLLRYQNTIVRDFTKKPPEVVPITEKTTINLLKAKEKA